MNPMKKTPLRKCVITNELFPKKELIRIVRSQDGEVSIDLTGKKSGRGAYISKNVEAIKLAKKKSSFDHHLEVKVQSSLYDELIGLIEKERLTR